MNSNLEMSTLIAEKVRDAGGRAYFVGGYVRDRLLGKVNKDIDIEVYGLPVTVLQSILSECGKLLIHGNSFCVFGLKGYDLDISVPRKERCIGTKHTDFEITVDPFISIHAACMRRDLTMNAIMMDILTGDYIDPFNGILDINNDTIRHINDETFIEDPLRVLRVAQFASRFSNMSVSTDTINLCKNIDISNLSKERIFTEMEKALLKSDKPSIFFNTLKSMGQLSRWFSEVERMIGLPQNEFYHTEGDVYTHTMMVLDTAAKFRHLVNYPLGFMLSALCHDMGKIITTEQIDGITHSYKHAEFGESIILDFISRITSNVKLLKYVTNLSAYHMDTHTMFNNNSRFKKTNALFDKSVCPNDLIYLTYCDSIGRIPRAKSTSTIDADIEFTFLLKRLDLYRDTMSKPYVTGKDLIAIGYTPSERFSEILRLAHKLRLAGIDKESAIRQILGTFKIYGGCNNGK